MSDDRISDEDKQLFRKTVAKIKIIRHSNTVRDEGPADAFRKPFKQAVLTSEIRPLLSDYIAEPVDGDSVLNWSRGPLPARRFREFRNGCIAIDSRIDLHGMSSEEAREQLLGFLTQAQQSGHRCLLIVHGKGGRSHGQPIIKNLLNRWLPQLSFIQAFHSATPKHGGTGAIYVLIKKPVKKTIKR